MREGREKSLLGGRIYLDKHIVTIFVGGIFIIGLRQAEEDEK